jgi:hypothetical protein
MQQWDCCMECKLCLQKFELSALCASATSWIVPTFSRRWIGLDIPLFGKFDRELAFLAFCGKIARTRSAPSIVDSSTSPTRTHNYSGTQDASSLGGFAGGNFMNLIAVIGLLCLSVFLVVVASFSPWLLAGCALISIVIASRSLIG